MNMKLIMIGFSVLLGISASANETTFFVNQKAAQKGSLELGISRERSKNFAKDVSRGEEFETSSNSTVMDLNYTHGINESSVFSVGTKFVNRSTSSLEGGSAEVNGFRSFDLGYKYGMEYDTFSLIFGGDASLSPGAYRPAISNRLMPDYRANNAQGYHSLSPYLGIESYINEFALGGRVSFNYFTPVEDTDGYIQVSNRGAETITRLSGFIEIPMEAKWDLGIFASTGRNDSRLDQALLGSRKNETAAGVYTNYDINSTSSLTAELKSEEKIYPYAESSTDLGIIYRKSM